MRFEISQENRAGRTGFALIIGIAVFAAMLLAACDELPMEEPGDVAPDFELTLFETPNHAAGDVLRLSELKGQPVVLNFWFPSCPPCVAEMPDLEASFQEHKADGVAFIGVQLVGIDTAQDGQDFVNELGVTYALGADEDGEITFQKYEVPGFPTTLFLNENHELVRKWSGPLNREKLEELIQELVN